MYFSITNIWNIYKPHNIPDNSQIDCTASVYMFEIESEKLKPLHSIPFYLLLVHVTKFKQQRSKFVVVM